MSTLGTSNPTPDPDPALAHWDGTDPNATYRLPPTSPVAPGGGTLDPDATGRLPTPRVAPTGAFATGPAQPGGGSFPSRSRNISVLPKVAVAVVCLVAVSWAWSGYKSVSSDIGASSSSEAAGDSGGSEEAGNSSISAADLRREAKAHQGEGDSRIRESQSDQAVASNNEGNRLSRAGDKEGAKRKYNEAIASAPEDEMKSLGYSNRGAVQSGEALKLSDFNQAIKLDSTNASAYFNRGLLFTRRKSWDLALADFNKAVALYDGPSDKAGAYVERGRVFQRRGRDEQALGDYYQAIRLNPNSWSAHRERGLIFLNRKSLSRARAEFSQAIKLANSNSYEDSDEADALYWRSQVEDGAGNRAQQLADITAAIKLSPKDPFYFYERGFMLLGRNDLKGTMADASHAIALNPRYAAAYQLRSVVYDQKGNRTRARADLARYHALGGKS